MVFLTDELIARIQALKLQHDLPEPPPPPRLPELPNSLTDREKIHRIQRFIESFEYNHTGQPFVHFTKNRGMAHITVASKEIIRAALPIQCVEAVFIGCQLTAGLKFVDRVPLSFKSRMGESYHRHIVLALRIDSKWGAIGISRRSTLMNKEIRFNSLAELVEEYRQSYKNCFHRLMTIYLGLPFSHDIFSDVPIKWRALKLKIHPYNSAMIQYELDQFTTSMLRMQEYFQREGCLPGESTTRHQQQAPYSSPPLAVRANRRSNDNRDNLPKYNNELISSMTTTTTTGSPTTRSSSTGRTRSSPSKYTRGSATKYPR